LEPVPDVIREGGPPDLPEMFWKDESHQRDRGSGRHQKGPQAPRIMGGKSSAPGQSDWATQGPEYSTDYSTSHIPISDKCLYVDPEYPETLPS